jgi:hypothetical protein
MDARASRELQAEELIDTIEHVLSQVDPDPEELVGFMQLAFEVSTALSGLGAMSQGRRISVNGLIARLVQLHRELAKRLTVILRQIALPQPIPSVQLPSGAARLFKP